MVAVSETERSYAKSLGKIARSQLPHLDWEEAEPHLMLGWKSSTHAESLDWLDVRDLVYDGWACGVDQ